MKKSVRHWVKDQITRLGVSGDCLEIGSYDVNGNLRDILSHLNHYGVDMREGPGVDQVANSNNLPFQNNSFDAVISVETLEHDRCFWKSITEIKRVLKPGGAIILTAPTINFGIHDHPADYWRFTEEGLKSLIEDWCTEIVSQTYDRGVYVAGRHRGTIAEVVEQENKDKRRPDNISIIYYTDNSLEEPLFSFCQRELIEVAWSKRIISVSQEPLNFGDNICVGNIGRSHISLFTQLLIGAKAATTRYIALAEHDCLYSPEHLNWIPPSDNYFYYNVNHWFVQWGGEHSGMYSHHRRKVLSNLICNRELLIKAVEEKLALLKAGAGIRKGVLGACEFGVAELQKAHEIEKVLTKDLGKNLDNYRAESFKTKIPNLDIRHGGNFSGGRKAKHRRYNLPYWGDFHSLIDIKPSGTWYQEATINGEVMPTYRSKDTNESRWQTFLSSLVSAGQGPVIDLGCNAGFYSRKFAKLGYSPIGVEQDYVALRQAYWWESHDPRNIKFVESDINDFDFQTCCYALLANVHYWLTPEQLQALTEKFKQYAVHVLVLARHATAPEHKSPADISLLQKHLQGWGLQRGNDHGKHFSVLFSNPELLTFSVQDLCQYQQFMQSKKYLPSFSRFIHDIVNGIEQNPLQTDYFAYLKWRRFKNPEERIKTDIALIKSIKEEGLKEPLTIGRYVDGKYMSYRLTDGDHRLIIAKELGIPVVVCKKLKQAESQE